MFAIRKAPSLATEWGKRVGWDQKETDNYFKLYQHKIQWRGLDKTNNVGCSSWLNPMSWMSDSTPRSVGVCAIKRKRITIHQTKAKLLYRLAPHKVSAVAFSWKPKRCFILSMVFFFFRCSCFKWGKNSGHFIKKQKSVSLFMSTQGFDLLKLLRWNLMSRYFGTRGHCTLSIRNISFAN